jgi:choline-sulfatase
MVGGYVPGSRPVLLAVRSAEWKYVRLLDGEVEEQLFHLTADPHELRDLAADPAQAQRLEGLRRRLGELMAAEGIPAAWAAARPRVEGEALARPQPPPRNKRKSKQAPEAGALSGP